MIGKFKVSYNFPPFKNNNSNFVSFVEFIKLNYAYSQITYYTIILTNNPIVVLILVPVVLKLFIV